MSGLCLRGEFDGIAAVAGLGADDEVRLRLEQRPQATADDHVVICQQNPHHHLGLDPPRPPNAHDDYRLMLLAVAVSK